MYRQLIDRENFAAGVFDSNITLVNWPQNDYLLGNILEVDGPERERHREGAAQLSLSLLYWLQTEAPRPDGKLGWKGLRLRPDVVGTRTGLAKLPYIRESRRIKAEFIVLEQHLRGEPARTIGGHPVAPSFFDSVGVGHYSLDTHPTTGGDNYYHVSCPPFQIPLGCADPTTHRELACRLQEHWLNPPQQRSVPIASRRMEHRRSGRRAGCVLPRAKRIAAAGSQ